MVQKMVLLPLSLLTAMKANCEVWPGVIFRKGVVHPVRIEPLENFHSNGIVGNRTEKGCPNAEAG